MDDITVAGWIRGTLYRIVMRLAHRFNWHYAPPIYPDGDTQLWCKWCGFREMVKRRNDIKRLIAEKKLTFPNAARAEWGEGAS